MSVEGTVDPTYAIPALPGRADQLRQWHPGADLARRGLQQNDFVREALLDKVAVAVGVDSVKYRAVLD